MRMFYWKSKYKILLLRLKLWKCLWKSNCICWKKAQNDDEKEHINENAELVQLLRQQNTSLPEENASKNEIIKILFGNLSIVNKKMCDTN